MADCKSPCEIVTDGWSISQTYATDAFNGAISFLDQFTNVIDPNWAVDIPSVDVTLDDIKSTIGPISIGDAPVAPSLVFSSPSEPSEPTLNPVTPINPTSPPEFIASFPVIELPAAPSALSAQEPGAAPVFNTPDIPDAPVYVIPDTPTLRELMLPDAPALDNITFDMLAPDDSLTAPEEQFNFVEPQYDSELLDAVNGKLLFDIQNGTAGLPAAVETAMFERAYNREVDQARRARQVAAEEFASRGFDLPPGALAARMSEVEQDIQDKGATLSREQYINQAERALQQLQFALTTAVQTESQLLNYANGVAQRAFEAQRASLDFGIQAFQARVQMYSARVTAYQGYAQVFKTRVEAELTKLEQYKAELEAQNLIGTMNQQDLEAYKAGLSAIESIVQIYSTEVQAAGVEAEVEKSKLEAYVAQIEAYKARIQAKATEYQGYTARIEGEMGKVSLFKGEVDAYTSQVQGYAALVDAHAKRTESDISVNRLLTETYKSRVAAYGVKNEAEATRLQAVADGYKSEISAYVGKVEAEKARVGAEATVVQSETDIAKAKASVHMKAAEVEIQRALQSLELLVEALKSGSTVSSALASAALSAVNLSGQISGSDTSSWNYNYQM